MAGMTGWDDGTVVQWGDSATGAQCVVTAHQLVWERTAGRPDAIYTITTADCDAPDASDTPSPTRPTHPTHDAPCAAQRWKSRGRAGSNTIRPRVPASLGGRQSYQVPLMAQPIPSVWTEPTADSCALTAAAAAAVRRSPSG